MSDSTAPTREPLVEPSHDSSTTSASPAQHEEPLPAPPPPLPTFWKAELRIMWSIGWPMAVSFFCRTAMMSMDSMFVGHIKGDGPSASRWRGWQNVGGIGLAPAMLAEGGGVVAWGRFDAGGYETKDYLAGASLSDMVTQVLTIPLMAMAFGLNPLIGQAMGSGNLMMAGTWMQVSCFCITAGSLPSIAVFFFVGNILTALGFDNDLCNLAGIYSMFSAIWVIPNSLYVAVRFYFQAQGISRPAMYAGIIFLAVNTVLNWCLVFGGPFKQWCNWPGFGFIGAALAISLSRSLQFVAYWVYMVCLRKAHRATWPGWNWNFFRVEYLHTFLDQTGPQVGTLFLQIAINQCITLLVAKLGTLAVASSSAATAASQPFTMLFLATLSSLAGIRVGFHLGSGCPDHARRTGWLVLGLGAGLMLAFAAVVLPFRRPLMSVVTSDKDVQEVAADLLPPVTLNFMAVSMVQCGTGGILASQGRTRLSTLLSACLELPLSLGSIIVLVLVFKADVRIVYWTQAAVSVVEALIVLVIVQQSDWERYARDAQRKQRRAREPLERGRAACTEDGEAAEEDRRDAQRGPPKPGAG